jgi:DNA-binding response OmpR family regulator
LRYLVDHQGKVACRIALESEVWGDGSNVVGVVVNSLRKKLADQAAMIETVHGTGTACGETDVSRSLLNGARQ